MGFELDVVAEPLDLFVRVGVATDLDEQRRVIRRDAGAIIDACQLTHPCRDPALAEDMLHRLAETQVDAQRQRREQLSQPNVHLDCAAVHAWSVGAER